MEMIGKTISHYKILEKLGEGGMGVVYKARDTQLERDVALKFLPNYLTSDPTEKGRFYHEARAASALNHPNITTIHEISEHEGQLFIAMELVEGKTLKQLVESEPPSIKRALDIAIQVCEGLAAAHEKGIVHRDIKSENLMLTAKGQAKIMDFGLAKVKGATRLTTAGSTLGTAAYMSPEQARGEEVDHRCDIFSFGVVLYELLTGKLPFRGEHYAALMYSILSEEPPPIARFNEKAGDELQRIVSKALAKDRGERYQHADDMLADLRRERKGLEYAKTGYARAPAAQAAPGGRALRRRAWIGLGVVIAAVVLAAILGKTYLSKPQEKPITSLAVLPFQNLSADPGQEYFSDGMTEAIIKELSQIKALRVISRTSVMRYKNTEEMVPEIARELGVDAVVEGSVLRADHDVWITAQLIAAQPEKHLWAEDFTRTLENVLLLQSEVAQAIAREIRVAVTPSEQERLARSRVVDPEAHEAYLKGEYFLRKGSPSDCYKSIEYFQRAIDGDSTYALAYAGMAETYDHLGSMGMQPPREAWPKVRAYTEKALALDPAFAEGILLLADVKFCYDWDVEGAEELYKRAIELDPNLALAHFWYGFFLVSRGQFGDGIDELKRAAHLDPLYPILPCTIAFAYELAGEYDSALVYLERAAEIDSSAACICLRKDSLHLRQGKYAEAIEEAKKGVSRGISPCYVDLAVAYALSGQADKARESLAKLFEWIGDGYLIMPALEPPWCDFIKSDPRYHDLMKRVGVEK